MQGVSEATELANQSLRHIYRPTKAARAGKSLLDRELKRIVALVDDQVVGTVQYRIVGNCLHLVGLAVHPEYQRRGIARRLVESLDALARQFCLHKLSLYTIRETGNVPIFERLGFRAVAEKPDELAESDTHDQLIEVYMERTVA
jgi:GNAT superfamily N-acetyltransferase